MNPHETTTVEPHAATGPNREGEIGFRLIGLMKLSSALMLAAAGFGIFRLMNRDLGASLEDLVLRFHLDPENRLVHESLSRIAGIDRAQLRAIGAGTFFYALLHLIEGTGLILAKPWAEYLTVIATGSLLPLEVYEILRSQTPIRFTVLGVNLAIFAYILFKIRQQRQSRSRRVR